MRRYKIIYVDRNDGGTQLLKSLESGWKIERADTAADYIVYVLYLEVNH